MKKTYRAEVAVRARLAARKHARYRPLKMGVKIARELPNGLCKCDLYSVWGSSPTDLYASGASGTLVHSSNRGLTWETRDPGTKDFLYGIWGSGPNDVYLAGTQGVYHSVDGGMTWPVAVAGTFEGIWGSDANNEFAVGTPGLIVRSIDGGKTWKTEASGVPMSGLTSVWGSGPTDIWIVGSENFANNSSTVLHSCGNGIWAQVPVPAPGGGFAYDFKSVWGTGPANVYAGATSEQLLHLH